VGTRTRCLVIAASAVVLASIGVACSTSGGPAAAVPEAGPVGEAFTACQIQGYVAESEAGLCPEGTCSVRAFDTNGGLLPCCTSVVSGPGMCIDGGVTDLADGSESGEDSGDGSDDAAESGGDAGTADAAGDSGSDGATESGADGASDGSPPGDAADGG
jgi:hypothetical protein